MALIKEALEQYEREHAQEQEAPMLVWCSICGKMLTDPISKAHGIGPDCLRKLNRGGEGNDDL